MHKELDAGEKAQRQHGKVIRTVFDTGLGESRDNEGDLTVSLYIAPEREQK